MHVEVEARPTASFSRYARYCWWRDPLAARDAGGQESTLDWRVRNAVDAELAKKGYEAAARAACDFVVAYTATTKSRQVVTFSEFADYRARGGEGGLQDVLGGYSEGTLVLLLFDARSRELQWRGSASAVVDPEVQRQRVLEAVRRMLDDLPPRTR